MRRERDVSTLTCPITEIERDFCDEMKRMCGHKSDADLVRTALYRFADHLDVPIAVQTFALRGGTEASQKRRARRYRQPWGTDTRKKATA